MTLFRLGVALFITAAALSATTFWWWAIFGMTHEVAIACLWTVGVVCVAAAFTTLTGSES